MASVAARLAAIEKRAVAAGKVKRPERDWRATVAPGAADRMRCDADGLLWYQPTDFEAQEIEAILTEAYRLNGRTGVVERPEPDGVYPVLRGGLRLEIPTGTSAVDDDDTWEPGYLPEPEPKDFMTKH